MGETKPALRPEEVATLAITGNSPVVVTPESIAVYFDFLLGEVEPVFDRLVDNGDLKEVSPGVYDITDEGINRIQLRGNGDLPKASDFAPS